MAEHQKRVTDPVIPRQFDFKAASRCSDGPFGFGVRIDCIALLVYDGRSCEVRHSSSFSNIAINSAASR